MTKSVDALDNVNCEDVEIFFYLYLSILEYLNCLQLFHCQIFWKEQNIFEYNQEQTGQTEF